MNENSEKQQEQEVDLVPVFVWIGNGFKSIFKGIGNVFKGLGHFFILFLIFIKNNIILLVALFIAGAGLGFYLDQESKNRFTAEIRVKPYFNSNTQLIANTNFYNSLVKEENYDRLAVELEIKVEEAKTIKAFTIDADFNDIELLKEYDTAARTADSTALVNYSFKDYKNSKRVIDYEYYLITVSGTDRDILEKIAEVAVRVKENSAIKAQKIASIESVKFNIQAMSYQLNELDSIISSFQKAIQKTKPQETGVSTNLYLGDSDSKSSITELFNQKTSLLNSLSSARLQKYYYNNTINIVSSYVKKGAIYKPHNKIKLAFAFLGFGLLLALIPVLWKSLNVYQSKLN
jgi:hypothetical protein